MAETALMWGLHAGKMGDADTLFLKKNYVGIGWVAMGDLTNLPNDQATIKPLVAQTYPDLKPNGVPVNAGQLRRFRHEMQPGHLVVYPSKRDSRVHIGQITGDYRYDPTLDAGYPNLRPVKWLKDLPRTVFTQGALYEIGSAMSLFLVQNYADEFRAALEGKAAPPPVDKQDETVALVVDDIEQTTRDFVLKRLAQELKGHPLAGFVGNLLETMGYRTRVSPEGPDGGIDIIAHKDELGFVPPIIKVQVKSTEGSIGDPVVKSLFGNVEHDEFGLFVTLGTFTNQARAFAKGKSRLRLIDGNELADLVLAHYDDLDSRYKGVLPLKRVFIPGVLGADD